MRALAGGLPGVVVWRILILVLNLVLSRVLELGLVRVLLLMFMLVLVLMLRRWLEMWLRLVVVVLWRVLTLRMVLMLRLLRRQEGAEKPEPRIELPGDIFLVLCASLDVSPNVIDLGSKLFSLAINAAHSEAHNILKVGCNAAYGFLHPIARAARVIVCTRAVACTTTLVSLVVLRVLAVLVVVLLLDRGGCLFD